MPSKKKFDSAPGCEWNKTRAAHAGSDSNSIGQTFPCRVHGRRLPESTAL